MLLGGSVQPSLCYGYVAGVERKSIRELRALTGWMGGFKHPIGILSVGDCEVIPFDLEMARGLFKERGAGKGMHVQLQFGGHGCAGVRWVERESVKGWN